MPNDKRESGTYDQSYIDAINRARKGGELNVSDLYEIYKNNPIDEANRIIEQLVKAGKEAALKNNTPTEFRDVSLNVTEFKKLKQPTGKEAVARVIQHILITKKGTYPNNPDFGVGIEDYLFEFANNTTKYELEENINTQMEKWLNKSIIQSNINTKHQVEFLRSANGAYNTLAIFFTVFDTNEKGNSQEYKINLFFTGDTSNRKVISQMDL